MLNRKCPGSLAGTPTLKIKKCPECGSKVEVFSNDVSVNCDNCGFTIYNDLESRIQWCKYAKYCVGEELYKKFKRIRIAFIGVDNTVRSVMAEALAKEMNTSPKLGFVSGGIKPAESVDPDTLEALSAENITWRGKPKDVSRIGLADIVVLMDPAIEIPPVLEKAEQIIRWDIPNPRGKGPQAYQSLITSLKDKVKKLMKEVSTDEKQEKKTGNQD